MKFKMYLVEEYILDKSYCLLYIQLLILKFFRNHRYEKLKILQHTSFS